MNVRAGTWNETPLHFAIKANKVAVVHYFMYGGSEGVVDVNTKSDEGLNALHYAAQTGNQDTLLMLVENGADVNVATDTGDSVLMLLVRHGSNIANLRMLLQFGADPTYMHPETGDNVLHLYIKTISGHYSAKDPGLWFVKYGGGAVLRTKNKEGLDPEMLALKLSNHFGARLFMEIGLRQNTWAIGHILYGSLRAPVFCTLIHFLGWLVGGALGGMFCLGENYLLISFGRGDHLFGVVWGVLVTFLVAWYIFLAPYVSTNTSILFTMLTAVVCYLSVQVAGTDPHYGDMKKPTDVCVEVGCEEERDEKASLLLASTGSGSASETEDESDGAGASRADEEGRGGCGGRRRRRRGKLSASLEAMNNEEICTTCMLNKKTARTVHCSRCDRCVEDFCHHCLFGMNCVGRGNRRVFTIWAGCVGMASLFMAFTSLWVTNYALCPDSTGMLYGQLAVHLCLAQSGSKILTILIIGAFGTAFGMSGCCMSHLVFVANETTAFHVTGGRFVPRREPLSTKLFRVLEFFRTGEFTVKLHSPVVGHPRTVDRDARLARRAVKVGPSFGSDVITAEPFDAQPIFVPKQKACCGGEGHSHSHDHSHDHGHSHGHNHGGDADAPLDVPMGGPAILEVMER
jgi:hypothetical protein